MTTGVAVVRQRARAAQHLQRVVCVMTWGQFKQHILWLLFQKAGQFYSQNCELQLSNGQALRKSRHEGFVIKLRPGERGAVTSWWRG